MNNAFIQLNFFPNRSLRHYKHKEVIFKSKPYSLLTNMNKHTIFLCFLCVNTISTARTTPDPIVAEINRYQKSLSAVQEKINKVVNLEWRVSQLEGNLKSLEQSSRNDQQVMVNVEDYYESGHQYSEGRESLAAINKTVNEAINKVRDLHYNVENVQQQVTILNDDVAALNLWREKVNFEDVDQVRLQLEDVALSYQDVNVMTRQLQNETHDLREEVSNVNSWVRRMKDDFNMVFDSIRTNLSEIRKERQDSTLDKTVIDIAESENP